MYLNDSLSAGLLAILHSSGKVNMNLTPDDYLTIGHGNFELAAGALTYQFLKQLDTSVPKLVPTATPPNNEQACNPMEDKQNENLHQEEPPTG